MAGLKLIFKMPDDETMAKYISIKGEKGDPGDPTKTSQLENDSDFTTNAALSAGLATKANASTVQSISAQVDTNTSAIESLASRRILINKLNAGSGRWYKIATLPIPSDTAKSFSVRLHGRIGDVRADRVQNIDIVIVNRTNGVMALGDIYRATDYNNNTDFVFYQNADASGVLYMKLAGYSTVDIDIHYADSVDEYDGTYVTAEPSGTLLWSLWEDENVQINIGGIISANIDGDAATVNGHTVNADVPANALFTDTVYDDTAIQADVDAKADAVDVANTYATKQEVQSLGSGSPIPVGSIAEMTDTTRAYLLTTSGHWYYYNGSAWADGGVYQATEIADGSVTERKLSFYERTSQLFDYREPNIVHLIPNINTNLVVVSANSSTVVLPCLPSTTYTITITASGRKFVVFDTANFPTTGEAVLGRNGDPAADRTSTKTITFTTAATANYLSIFFWNTTADSSNDYDARIKSIMVSQGSTVRDWQPYAVLSLDGAGLIEGSITPDKLNVQWLYMYDGYAVVDKTARTLTFSDWATSSDGGFLTQDLKTRLTIQSGVSGTVSFAGISGVVYITATRSGTQITGFNAVRFKNYNGTDPVIFAIFASSANGYVATSIYDYGDRLEYTSYNARNPLFGKKIGAIGDSLIYGNNLGNGHVWLHKLALKNHMTEYNYGINGNPIAAASGYSGQPMSVRYSDMADDLDYVVVLGGANDRRLNVPIGTESDATNTTFKGALKILIEGLLTKYPGKKILFLTNYNRVQGLNSAGLEDKDYVDAMLEMCALYGIPCFDNYRKSGISWHTDLQTSWADEGVSLGGSINRHFSDAGYDFLLPVYEQLLKGI